MAGWALGVWGAVAGSVGLLLRHGWSRWAFIVSLAGMVVSSVYSLGLSKIDEMRFVIMPQAIKRVLPALANEFINTIKYSALASVVSIQELTFMGRSVVESTGKIFEVWITVSLMYLILTMTISLMVNRLEVKMRKGD